MTDDNQADAQQALPATEFDVRAGLRGGVVAFERAAPMPCKVTVNEGTWHAVSMDEEDAALASAVAALGSTHGILGLDRMPKPRWTAPELEILDSVYPLEGKCGVHALLPHRSMEAITGIARACGIGSDHRRPWTDKETAIVLANYPTLGAKCTAALLPGRLPQDIRVYRNMRGVHRVREAA